MAAGKRLFVIFLTIALAVMVALSINLAFAGPKISAAEDAPVTGELTLDSFVMQNSASIRAEAPVGIRFQTEISEEDLAKLPSGARFGTLLIPAEILGENELTIDAEKVLDVPSTRWKKDSTESTKIYSGVLVGTENADFPEAYYGEDIVARAYVTYKDSASETHVIYAKNVVKKNIAWVAGYALASGYADENGLCKNIVDAAIGDSVPEMVTESAVLYVGDSTTYFVNGIGNIPAIINVAGEAVTVNDGIVTAQSAGEATVTAVIGTKRASKTITVVDTAEKLPATYVLTSEAVSGTVNVALKDVDVSDIVAVKGAEIVSYNVEGGKLSVALKEVTAGKREMRVYTSDNVYIAEAVLATNFISTNEEFAAFMNNHSEGGYHVLTKDLDFGGATVRTSMAPGAGLDINTQVTLDGAGHFVKNFVTDNFLGRDVTYMTITNIGLQFVSNGWTEGYNAVLASKLIASTIENVFIDVTVNQADYTRGIISAGCSGNYLRNTVIKVTLAGTGTGNVCYGSSLTGWSNLNEWCDTTNLYVLSEETLTANDSCSQGTLVSDVSEISEIDGSFSILNGVLYFYGSPVAWEKENGAEVKRDVLFGYAEGVSVNLAELEDTLGQKVKGSYVGHSVSGGSAEGITFDGLNLHVAPGTTLGERKIVLGTTEKAYTISMAGYTTALSAAQDVVDIIGKDQRHIEANEYIVLLNDIDMNGVSLYANRQFAGTLDGRGHKLYNYSSIAFALNGTNTACIKNIAMIFTQTDWTSAYPGVITSNTNGGINMENVYMEITIGATNYTYGLFGKELPYPGASYIRNCVFNIVNDGTPKTMCDVINNDLDKWWTEMGATSVYVITNGNTFTVNQFKDIIVVEKPEDVGKIGGAFGKDEEGLKFYGNKI